MNSKFQFIDTPVSFLLSIVLSISLSLLLQVLGEILEKVIIQYSRDAGKQLGVDILFAEYLVHIGPAAR